jgi:nucleoside-diphosphate-sugar epimerase
MRIFITGGTGFIGSHLVTKLEKTKHEIFVLRKRLGDIKKWQSEVAHFKPQVAIHLAWEGIPDFSAVMSIKNLQYGLDLFRMLARIGCQRIITVGSCWEYGTHQWKLNEEMAVRPFNAFTAAKNALHWLGQEIAKESKVQFIWARLFYVYGPGQKKQSLIPYIIDCAQRGIKPEIKTPKVKNDFIYIEDVIKALICLIEKNGENSIYNVGSGKATSIEKIIQIIYDKLQKKISFPKSFNQSNKGTITDFWADISRMKKDFGWAPQTQLSQGIQKTIKYYL